MIEKDKEFFIIYHMSLFLFFFTIFFSLARVIFVPLIVLVFFDFLSILTMRPVLF
jgi:hypothetical protein